jgi:hypothetical protein
MSWPATNPVRTAGVAMVALLALGAGDLACRRASGPPAAPPRPALGAVVVEDVTPQDAAPVRFDQAAVQQGLRARLLASGLFASASPDAESAGPTVRVRCDVGLEGAEVEQKGLARAAVRLRLDTRPSDAPGALEQDLSGQGEQVYAIAAAEGGAAATARIAAKQALFARLAVRVAGDLIEGFAARERMRTASPALLHQALSGDGGDLQEEAIRIVGDRKLRQEAPTLLVLLEHPSESVRDAALGALIQMEDRRAVSVLTKSRSLRDRREMRKVLEAIATLGGDEALDYLSFVAQSHDDEEIRDLATAAKARLERRMKVAGGGPEGGR